MDLPLFYIKSESTAGQEWQLDEDGARHITVLRMQTGDSLLLTDGRGSLTRATISRIDKKKVYVEPNSTQFISRSTAHNTIAISPLKNASRFEWFLEKAAELGIHRILPLLCQRTERHQLRLDRLNHILVSAMLQSQQSWLPELLPPVNLMSYLKQEREIQQCFIAHCASDQKIPLSKAITSNGSRLVLIGPEGDFTKEEIDLALHHRFIAVDLGQTRLRAETAGVAAAVLLSLS